MTVATSTARSGPYAGAGTTGPFTVGFRFLANDHLRVIKTSVDGIGTTLTLGVDYTVAGAGAPTGTVTTTIAVAIGETLTIIRDVPFTQELDYVQNDDFPAESHEAALDKLTMEVQQVAELAGRALTLPATVPPGTSTELPAPSANDLIGWNSDASGLQNVDPTTLATIVAFGTAVAVQFSGTGVATDFTLPSNPGVLANLDISIGGVDQRAGIDYSWSGGTTLTFAVAPPLGTNNIQVKYKQALPQGATDSAAASFIAGNGGAVLRTAQDKMRDILCVFDFMTSSQIADVRSGAASGDVTSALQTAANSLHNGQSLYFPAGDYIVNSGCVLFRGKTRICIYGDGAATRLHPTGQGPTGVKQDYPTTLAIDQCSFVTLRDMVIESKGENYGNTDAYGGLLGGDPRTNAIINFGGSAVLVARSDHVTLKSVDARYAGSVGVVYLSSSENVVVEDCFANALSLGYAGFALDNWADSSVKTLRTYKLIDCRVNKEGASYSSKCGIASEGDQVTGRLINLEIVGGVYEDAAIGQDAPQYGCGISAIDTRVTMTGVVTKNNYVGLHFTKRGGAVDPTWCRVSSCQFIGNLVAGVYVNIGTATGGADVVLNYRADMAATSVWAGIGAVTDQSVKVSAGLTVGGFLNGSIKLVSCTLSGGQYGIYAIDNATFSVTGGDISGSVAAIRTYGGGTLKATGAKLQVTAGDRVIGRDTANFAAAASYDLFTYVTNCLLECFADTASDFPVILSGNSALFVETAITGNQAPKGQYSVSRGSATLFDIDFGSPWTPVVRGSGTAGTYQLAGVTVTSYLRKGRLVTVNAYIVLAGVVTGGGTGDLQITGLPYPKRAGTAAWGTVAMSGVTYSAGKQVACYFGTTSSSSSLLFWESASGAVVTLTPISAVAANSIVAFSITYEI